MESIESYELEHQTLMDWRLKTLDWIMYGSYALSVLMVSGGVYNAYNSNSSDLIPIYLGMLTFLTIMVFLKKLGFSFRAIGIITLFFIVGFHELSVAGLVSDAKPFLFTSVILTQVFFKLRYSIISLLIALSGFAVTGYLAFHRIIEYGPGGVLNYYPHNWISSSFTFLFLTTCIIFAIDYLVRKLTESLDYTREIVKRLKVENQVRKQVEDELQILNHELEDRVEQRTNQLKEINLELESEKLRAESGSHAKSLFLSNMSHEIRTPLNAIMGFSELLMGELKNKSEELALEFSGYIKVGCNQMSELLNNVLDIAKVEYGKMDVAIESVNLEVLCKHLFQLHTAKASAKKITFRYEVDKIFQTPVLTDRLKLNQIINNLLANAIKFTNEGGAITLSLEKQDSWFIVRIKDNGIGIDKEKQKDIFQPFEQELSTTSLVHGGTGLGLTIVKQNAELMDGMVLLESQKGNGAEFAVKIPYVRDEQLQLDEFITEETITKYSGKKVLLVEDRKMNQRLIEEVLRRMNVFLDSVPTRQEALDYLKVTKPDLILMDIRLPDGDGIQLTAEIFSMEETRDTPVIIVSANALKEQIEQAMDIGVREYLVKPVSIDVLTKAIANNLQV